jgi:hypothetical protein
VPGSFGISSASLKLTRLWYDSRPFGLSADAACERFKALGCEFTKSPNSGGMKGLAFIKDPDGYLVEVLPQGPMITKPVDCNGVTVDGGPGYKDNSK